MLAQSRITSQGQVSIPAEVRRRLAVKPGDTLAWEEKDGGMFVRRKGRYTLEDLRKTLGPPPAGAGATLKELRASIADHMRKKHGGK